MRYFTIPTILVFALGVASVTRADILTGPITNPSNSHTYFLTGQHDWTESEAHAIALGGHLVTIDDAAENAWVVSTFAEFGGVSRALWIGLNDAASEGTFVWASGEPVVYTNWGPGEPNNHLGIEDWAHIFPSTDSRHPTWNDAPNFADNFGFVFNGVVEVTAIPEPCSLALMVVGLSSLGAFGIWRRCPRALPA